LVRKKILVNMSGQKLRRFLRSVHATGACTPGEDFALVGVLRRFDFSRGKVESRIT
jgi:hypothetical protein